METYSLYHVEFRRGPSVDVIALAIGSAMIDAVEIVNDGPDGPEFESDLTWQILDIVRVEETNSRVHIAPSVFIAKEVMVSDVGGSSPEAVG